MIDINKYQNEDAIDLLANVMEPAAEIIGDAKFKAKWNSGKPVMFAILYAMREHKKALVQIVCAVHGETPETYKFNPVDFLRDVNEIMESPLFTEVFSSQTQKTESASSGSAMENTGETAKE